MDKNLRLAPRVAVVVLFPIALAAMLPVIVLFAAALYVRVVYQAMRALVLLPLGRRTPVVAPRQLPHIVIVPEKVRLEEPVS